MSNGNYVSLHKEVYHLNSRVSQLTEGQIAKVKLTHKLNVRFTVQPNGGLWNSRKILFELNVAKNYPNEACEVTCLSRIAHPNIYNHGGAVCLSSLEEDWTSSMRLEDYVMGVLFLLHNPNFDDPLSDDFCNISLETALALAVAPTKDFYPVETFS